MDSLDARCPSGHGAAARTAGSDHGGDAIAPRALRWTALVGAVAWLALRAVPSAPHGLVERVLLLAVLTVSPLGFALLPEVTGPQRTVRAAVAMLMPVAAAAAVGALWLPDGGLAAALASPWLGLTGLAAALGVLRLVRLVRTSARRNAAEVLYAAALLYLPLGGAWLVTARSGVAPFGFELDPLRVTVVAVHFHYAAFGGLLVMAPALQRIAEAPSRRSTRVGVTALATALVLGVGSVPVGIVVGPGVGLVASLLLAFGVLGSALALIVHVVPRVGWLPRTLLLLSALSALGSMALAVAWAGGEISGSPPVDLLWMIRLHGHANAHGFVLCGLLGWTALAAQSSKKRATSSQMRPMEAVSE